MSGFYTEDEAIAATEGLTRAGLRRFLAAQVIAPQISAAGPRYARIDLARLRLLCELSEDFDLDDIALAIIMSLLDQLHTSRAALRAMAQVLAEEPSPLRARLGATLRQRDEL